VVIALAIAGGRAHGQGAPEEQPPPSPVPPPEIAPGVTFDPDFFINNADALFEQLFARSPVLKDIAKGALRRARRKVSIGPTVGLFGGSVNGEGDYALSFGLGLETFKIPVLPSIDNLKAILKERAKAKLKQALIQTLVGQPPTQEMLSQLAAEAWDEAVREILGMDNIRAKRLERPSLSVGLEGNWFFNSHTPAVRLRLGTGVWKLSFVASATIMWSDPKVNVYLAPEVCLHVLMSKGPRASVLDLFVRAEFDVYDRSDSNDSFVVGTRYLLDLI
jgi:hypothetical protein